MAVGLALVAGEAEGLGRLELAGLVLTALGDGQALAEGLGLGGCSRALFTDEIGLAPLTRRAAGTTTIPSATVITKARAPHSRRQKALDELRIRARRPLQVGACSWC